MQNILQGLMLHVTKRGTRTEVGEGVFEGHEGGDDGEMMVTVMTMVMRR